jgi:hypothetical protein
MKPFAGTYLWQNTLIFVAQYYGAPSTTVIYQTPQPQTVVIQDHRSHGMGNLAAGMSFCEVFSTK